MLMLFCIDLVPISDFFDWPIKLLSTNTVSWQCLVHFFRKSLEEHQSNVDGMDDEEKGFEMSVAKSLVEIQKLEAQKQSQQQLLAEHFKNTMAITDADFGTN